MGWGICPTQVALTPAAVDYWYRTATDQDLFVSMDGLGYVYPDVYGAALGGSADWYRGFLERTSPFMQVLDQRFFWFLGGTSRASQMVSVLGLEGLYGEYGVLPTQRQEMIGDVAAIWSDVNPWEKPWDDPAVYAERIRARTPTTRPAFIFVGVNGFTIGPDQVAQIMRELGPDYVAVRPDELCALYRRYQEQGVDPNPAPRPALELPAPEPPPGPRTLADGTLLVREDNGEPEVAGWYTDPAGTPWVRKRLTFDLPAGAREATVHLFVRGQKGKQITVRVNGTDHTATLDSSRWHWASLSFPASDLRSGENEIWYTGNPDARLTMAGTPVPGLQHSEFGGPGNWAPLSGELLCYLEVR
jgi:hypothetical protein